MCCGQLSVKQGSFYRVWPCLVGAVVGFTQVCGGRYGWSSDQLIGGVASWLGYGRGHCAWRGCSSCLLGTVFMICLKRSCVGGIPIFIIHGGRCEDVAGGLTDTTYFILYGSRM